MGLAKQYLDRYHNLAVDLLGGMCTSVQLKNYVAGWKQAGFSTARPQLTGALKAKKAGLLPGQVYCIQDARSGEQYSITDERITWVFEGKGSPGDIATVLTMAQYCDLVRQPFRHYKRFPPPTLQDYCNTYIGLDCSGFASNFIGLANHSTWLGEFVGPNIDWSYCRKDARTVSAYDVLVAVTVPWGTKPIFKRGGTHANFDHVAVIDRVASCTITDAAKMTGILKLDVAEWGSAGGEKEHWHVGQEVKFARDEMGQLYGLRPYWSSTTRHYICQPCPAGRRVEPNDAA
jgi:hypothetical protein